MPAHWIPNPMICWEILTLLPLAWATVQEAINGDPFKDPWYLRRDRALHPKVELQGEVTIDEILAAVSKGTGLVFTVDPSLKGHNPKYNFHPGPLKIAAWACLEHVADKQRLIQPVWLKNPKGYHLMAFGIISQKKEEEPKPALVKRFPLREDERLGAAVSVAGSNLTLDSLKITLEKATALKLTLDPKLGDHNPLFPFVQMRKGYAWAVMEMIARKDLDEGRWVKTSEGYELTAKSVLPSKLSANKPNQNKPTVTAANRPLRQDPRLQAKIYLNEKNPNLKVVLEKLQRATKLILSLDQVLEGYDPQYGSVQLGEARAWMVMELLAEKQLAQGRWEKTQDGYRLVGQPLGGPPSSYWKIIWLALGGLLVLAAGSFLAWRVYRKKKPGPAGAASHEAKNVSQPA